MYINCHMQILIRIALIYMKALWAYFWNFKTNFLANKGITLWINAKFSRIISGINFIFFFNLRKLFQRPFVFTFFFFARKYMYIKNKMFTGAGCVFFSCYQDQVLVVCTVLYMSVYIWKRLHISHYFDFLTLVTG